MEAKEIDASLRTRLVAGQKKFGVDKYDVSKNEQLAAIQMNHPRCADGCMCSASVAWRTEADAVLTELSL